MAPARILGLFLKRGVKQESWCQMAHDFGLVRHTLALSCMGVERLASPTLKTLGINYCNSLTIKQGAAWNQSLMFLLSIGLVPALRPYYGNCNPFEFPKCRTSEREPRMMFMEVDVCLNVGGGDTPPRVPQSQCYY